VAPYFVAKSSCRGIKRDGGKGDYSLYDLNQSDLSRATNANRGVSHQKLEDRCKNSEPKSITEKPPITPLLSGQCIHAMAEHHPYPEKTQFPK